LPREVRARAVGGDRRRCAENHTLSTVPITVRQLEAIVRISEALAKMRLDVEVTTDDVKEAIRLFKVSTLNAANMGGGSSAGGADAGSRELAKEVQLVEAQIQKSVAILETIETKRLVDSLTSYKGFSASAVHKAVQVMISRHELQHFNQQRSIKRLR
jgi:DNA replication licensing factor MCM5